MPSELKIEWNFFQVNHRKRAVDGIGGTINNTVCRRMQRRRDHPRSRALCYLQWQCSPILIFPVGYQNIMLVLREFEEDSSLFFMFFDCCSANNRELIDEQCFVTPNFVNKQGLHVGDFDIITMRGEGCWARWIGDFEGHEGHNTRIYLDLACQGWCSKTQQCGWDLSASMHKLWCRL